MRYVEWVGTPRGRKGTMVPLSLIPKIVKASYSSGYTTVYSFSEKDAREIKGSRSSRGFDRYSVGSTYLPIDLDDGEESVDEVVDVLKGMGLQFKVWFSGSKGFHIIIETTYQESKHLPYSHLQWVGGLGLGCDNTLYQHGRILSLPGRIHPRTGFPKQLIESVEGNILEVPIVEKPIFVYTGGGDVDHSFSSFMSKVSDLTLNEPRKDYRHTSLWGLSKDGLKSGVDPQTIYNLLKLAMGDWEYPKEDNKLQEIINMARRQV